MSDTYELETSPRAEGGDLNVREYLDILRRHWRAIIAAGLLGVGGGLVHYFNTPDTFQATTRIQIERRSTNPLGNEVSFFESWWNPEFYPTQREILKSRGLALEVVRYLRLWEDPRFSGALGRATYAPGDGGVTAAEDMAVLGRLALQIRSGLDVREVRGTQLFDIAYRSSDREMAMILANGYAEAFIAYSQETRRTEASTFQGSIEQEIKRLEAQLATNDSRLLEYGRKADLLETDSDSNITMQRVQAANEAYLRAQNARILAQAAYNEIANRPPESVAERAGVQFSTQRAGLSSKQREYQTKLETYREDFPAMRELKEEIGQLETELDKLVRAAAESEIADKRSVYEAARQTEQQSLQVYQQMEAEARRLQATSNSHRGLMSEISTDRELLEDLRRRQGQTSVVVNSLDGSTIRQIDPALLPGGPTSPNLRNDALRGLLIGMVLAAGIVFLLELMDRTIKTPEEVERRFGLPTLAVIPDISARTSRYGNYGYGYGYGYRSKRSTTKKPRQRGEEIAIDRVPFTLPRLAVSEAYRSLRTSLLLSTADGLRVVAVSSATAGEGKTATSVNLAVVMAQLGRRTLLIDGDLRKARVHHVFGLSNRSGVVGYLVGLNDLESTFVPTSIDNLSAAVAGPIPPNPSELLSSQRMAYLLQEARGRFDFVVIDTPPALAVTDATMLGDMADGLVLCVRAGWVSRDDVKTCRDRFALGGVRLLGTVLNCHRQLPGRSQRNYSYHYESYGDPAESQANDAA